MMPKIREQRNFPTAGFKISSLSLVELHKHAYRAQQKDHLEVCGVLVVRRDGMIDLRFIANRSSNSYHYEISVEDITAIEQDLHRSSEWILGTFHSHPVAEAAPGLGDLEHGFFYGIELIYDVCGREAKLWKKSVVEGQEGVTQLSLEVVQEQKKRPANVAVRNDD